MVAVTREDDRDDVTGPGNASGPDEQQASLPAALSAALASFCQHLSAERALSRHTVRAYQGDIQSLLEYATQTGIVRPGELTLDTLRGWLAEQHRAGAARATLARRGAAARAFTAYAWRRGRVGACAGAPAGETAGGG